MPHGLREARTLLPGPALRHAMRASPLDEPVLYDSRDLVTHAVCVGMTGSGKTGLVPVADRGGGDRRRAGHRHRSEGRPRQPAADVPAPVRRRTSAPGSTKTKRGDAGQLTRSLRGGRGRALDARDWPSGGRTARGSSGCGRRPSSPSTRRAAAPACRVSILSSFAAPPAAARDDAEALAERAATTATSLLVACRRRRAAAEPRAHAARRACSPRRGRAGRDLDLAALIQQVQTPPFEQGRRPRPRGVLSRRRSASSWRCA